MWYSLQYLFETFLILTRNGRHMMKMYIVLHVKYPLFSPECNGTWIFSTDFSENSQISNFTKIRPVGRSDMTKLIVAFWNFKNAPKKVATLCIELRISHTQSSVCQQLFANISHTALQQMYAKGLRKSKYFMSKEDFSGKRISLRTNPLNRCAFYLFIYYLSYLPTYLPIYLSIYLST